MVLPLLWEELVESEGSDLQLVFNSMTKQIQSLLTQKDAHLEVPKYILTEVFALKLHVELLLLNEPSSLFYFITSLCLFCVIQRNVFINSHF